MRLGYLATLLKSQTETFSNRVGGAAELNIALQGTLEKDVAFIIPLVDAAGANTLDGAIQQTVQERFGIVVAIANDSTQADKYGLLAYDKLHDIRSELFSVYLNKYIPEAEGPIYYVGGKIITINRGYLWYQFEFEYMSRLDNDGLCLYEVDDTEEPVPLNTIYANLINPDNPNGPLLPYDGNLPLDDGFPDVLLPDMGILVNFQEDPAQGSFTGSFASGFKIFDEDRRY